MGAGRAIRLVNMLYPVARLAVSAFVLFLGACGGKILDERGGGGVASSSGAGTSPVASSEEGKPASGLAPAPTKSHADDPCATICQGNGGCVGGQRECLERCGDDLGSASCTLEASVYVGCYADHIDNRGLLGAAARLRGHVLRVRTLRRQGRAGLLPLSTRQMAP